MRNSITEMYSKLHENRREQFDRKQNMVSTQNLIHRHDENYGRGRYTQRELSEARTRIFDLKLFISGPALTFARITQRECDNRRFRRVLGDVASA